MQLNKSWLLFDNLFLKVQNTLKIKSQALKTNPGIKFEFLKIKKT